MSIFNQGCMFFRPPLILLSELFGAEIGIVTLSMVKTVGDTCQAFYRHILGPPFWLWVSFMDGPLAQLNPPGKNLDVD